MRLPTLVRERREKIQSDYWKRQQLIIILSSCSFQIWVRKGPGVIKLVRNCESLGSLQHVREKGKCVSLGNRLFSCVQALYFV